MSFSSPSHSPHTKNERPLIKLVAKRVKTNLISQLLLAGNYAIWNVDPKGDKIQEQNVTVTNKKLIQFRSPISGHFLLIRFLSEVVCSRYTDCKTQLQERNVDKIKMSKRTTTNMLISLPVSGLYPCCLPPVPPKWKRLSTERELWDKS